MQKIIEKQYIKEVDFWMQHLEKDNLQIKHDVKTIKKYVVFLHKIVNKIKCRER